MTIGIIALARPTFDVDFAEAVAAEAFSLIDGLGLDVVGDRALLFDAESTAAAIEDLRAHDLAALVVLQVTFTDATMTKELAGAIDAPLIFWAFPEDRTGGRLRLNALCGINLAGHALRRLNRSFSYLYARPGDPTTVTELTRLLAGGANVDTAVRLVPDAGELSANALAAADRVGAALDGLRTGVIGDFPDGFDPCRYDPEAVRRLTGITVDRVELTELFARADQVPSPAVAQARERAAGSLGSLDDLDQGELDNSLRLYGGLQSLVIDNEWAGLATRCWPECFTEYGGAACAPQAMLSDDGTPSMCEADVYGTLTGLILQELSGEAPFVADLVDIDPDDNSAAVWHCGLAPLSMVGQDADASPTVHSNRRKPLLHEFVLKPGRVTIARLSQAADRHQLVVGGGEMLPAPLPFSGTAGVVRFDKPAADVLATIMAEGLEHHYGIVYGEYEEELLALAAKWELPVVNLT
ncbi:MAG: hypothetical protein OER12_00865 [Acidimicrobiia bacterium]|nr:hypothetical protein [Acidimicrobiia bacterium]